MWEGKEQPSEGFDEAYLNEKIAKASNTWKGVDVDKYMAEMRGYEQPSEDLEEAAISIWKCRADGDASQLVRFSYDEVLALMRTGARWQKSQMLKDAVDGKIEEVSFNNGELHNTIFFSFNEESLHVENRIWFPRCGKEGDKVKIVIIPDKED